MQIDVSRLKDDVTETFEETVAPKVLDIDTQDIVFEGAVNIVTQVKKEFGVLRTKSHLSAKAKCICSRCLKEYYISFEKDYYFDYSTDKVQFINPTQEVREEVIVDYPVKFLCKQDCKGICPKCCKDLNEGKCSCQENN